MNLYVHFPFCRRKCTYCALYSRTGTSEAERSEYVSRLASSLPCALGAQALKTVYFGGGSPALCDLRPLFGALEGRLAPDCEFTVELHPLDVTQETLSTLASGGVNRVSMGVQSLDDGVLKRMGRGYTADEAERAFALVKHRFANAGIDLIAGYPGEKSDVGRLASWGIKHCSVYSLILEEGTALSKLVANGRVALPDDDETLDEIAAISSALAAMGLERYEISNYALPGCECRHNMAVWRGEDYIGLGAGAHGRVGRTRTFVASSLETETSTLTPEEDALERALFSLRTREGLDSSAHPEWREKLDYFVSQSLLTQSGGRYILTPRGTDVCDSILAELL